MPIPWGGSGYKVPVANDAEDATSGLETNSTGGITKYTHSRGQLTEYGKKVFGPGEPSPSTDTDHDEMPSMSEDKKFTEDLHSRKSDGKFIESSGNSQQKHKRPTK